MSKIFDNIETKFEEWLYAIPGSGDRTWLLKIGNMSLMSPKKAFELTMNCAISSERRAPSTFAITLSEHLDGGDGL